MVAGDGQGLLFDPGPPKPPRYPKTAKGAVLQFVDELKALGRSRFTGLEVERWLKVKRPKVREAAFLRALRDLRSTGLRVHRVGSKRRREYELK